jgi:hypothetical protein
MANSNQPVGGIGFGGALVLLFITLKLCGVIEWSWWWVLSPIWIGFGALALFIAFCLAMAAIAGQLPWQRRK